MRARGGSSSGRFELCSCFVSVVVLIFFLSATQDLECVQAGKFNEERIADLLGRQSRAKDAVIRLDDESLRMFATPTPEPRPYALIIFFDADQLRSNAELKLETLRAEFGLVATTFTKNNPDNGRVFFVDLEFKHSQASFSAFGVSTLPNIKHLPAGDVPLKQADNLDQGEVFRLADGMIRFVESKTKFAVGPIERPPAFSVKQFLVLIAGLLVASPFVIMRIIAKDTFFHDPKFWCFSAVVIYFFSVSGGMHNIIRKMPFFMTDRNNPAKVQFFYQGSGMQLGAEGFVVGSLYTLVGLLLAGVSHVLHEIRSKTAQRAFLLAVMGVGFIAVRKMEVENRLALRIVNQSAGTGGGTLHLGMTVESGFSGLMKHSSDLSLP